MTDPCVPSNTDLSPTWRDDLFSLLDRQQGICFELHRLSERQAELIQTETAASLLELLSQRQTLIDDLTGISLELEPYRTRWPELWPQLDRGEQERFDAAVAAVESTISLIRNHDQHAQSRIKDVKSGIECEIRTMNTGRASARAYAQSSNGSQSNRWTRRYPGEGGPQG